ncbi:MAG: oligosaccharide flippase family protein [Terrimicrobiaceae bacterium]|nr:oligosaccharide flippase family protein [Terrimicrobiaceae bacterium]
MSGAGRQAMIAQGRKGLEILGWQGVSKLISIFAFAHAARVLGPERFGISGIVLSVAMQIVAFSSLLNETFLARRFRRARSAANRQALITAAGSGRLILAICMAIPAAGLGLLMAPSRQWWLAIFAALPLVAATFLQPSWILIGQDRSQLVWRTLGLGSLVTSALLFLLCSQQSPAGIDLLAVAAGSVVATFTAWRVACGKDSFRFRLSFRHLNYAAIIVRRGGWLFVIYLAANVYLYLDTFLLGLMGSKVDAGLFRPATNLAASFHQSVSFIPLLLFPKLLDWAKDGGDLRRRQIQIALGLIAWAAGVILVALFAAKPVFAMLYGPLYEAASGPFILLIAARSVGIVASVFTWGMIARDADRAVALIFVTGAVAALACNLILIPRIGLWGPAWAAIACDGLILVLSGWLSLRRPRVNQPAT